MAGTLGLLAGLCGLLHCYRQRVTMLTIPYLMAVPGLLVIALVIQYLLGRAVFPQFGLLYASYLLWAALLMLLGRLLADTFGLAVLADLIGAAFLLSATSAACIGIAQWLGGTDGVPWIFPLHGGGSYANLGQANHHAHHCWLGIASALYLRTRGYLSRSVLWALVLPICFASVLSGSRSIFLYMAALLAICAWVRYRDPRGPAARMLGLALALLPILAGLNIFGTWASSRLPDLPSRPAHTTQAQAAGSSERKLDTLVTAEARLRASFAGPSDRIGLARSAWSAFTEHPWTGQGAGNFRWASFEAGAASADDEPAIVGEHAHNLLLQLLAEFGAPATLAFVVFAIVWAREFMCQEWSPARLWSAAMLAIAAVHSLLEYPLWYSYFLGPTALLLGATSGGPEIRISPARSAAYLGLLAVAGAVVLGNLLVDYRKLELASNAPFALDADRERAWRMSMDHVAQLHRESLLSPWALWTLVLLAEPSRQQPQDRADLCQRGIRLSPSRWLVIRCAQQLGLAGRMDEALKLTRAAVRAYPAQRAATLRELRDAAAIYPQLDPLHAAAAR